MSEKTSLFQQLGGYPTLQKVHKIFYDKVYADAWIGLYFQSVKQETIEAQQTDFMAQAMGGPDNYCGKFPIPAHTHMYTTAELFDLRHRLLTEALDEAGVPAELKEKWLKIDGAFRNALIKKSVDECKKRFASDEILAYENPLKRKAA